MKTFAITDMARETARELVTSERDTENALRRAVDVIRRELQRGNSIDLEGLGVFKVALGQPEPVSTLGGGPLTLPAERKLTMEFNADLRGQVEGAGVYQILLVTPKRNFFTGVIASRLSSMRSEVNIAITPEEAREAIATKKPDLILLDLGVPEAAAMCEEIKRNRASSMTSVVIMRPEELAGDPLDGFIVRPDDELQDPFEISDLVHAAETELARASEERAFFEHSLKLRFKSREESLDRAKAILSGLLEQAGLAEDASAAYNNAVLEAVDNANRHGNQSNPERHIEIEYILDHEKVTLSVADEGEGFDTEVYLRRGVSMSPAEAARERHREGRVGGLGIVIMLNSVDRLEYNYVGNKVTLTRMFRKS